MMNKGFICQIYPAGGSMMKFAIAAVSALFVTSSLLFAQVNDTNRIFTVRKISAPIQVDGIIDPAWSLADSATNFFQLSPYYAKDPSRKTVAKLLTTDASLYCLMICYDDRSALQANTGTLDNTVGDAVSLLFDTFGDKHSAYRFTVGALGVRSDCRMVDDGRYRDYNWDGVWFAQTKVYDWGYVVEMEIPYRAIQYDEKLTVWGLDFNRWIPALNEDLYWCRYVQNEGQRISKFGTLQFENFHPSVKGLNLEIYPVGIAKATYLHDQSYKVTPDAGVDIFYNPSPSLTFQLTANPDFAQIEADPTSFNISRYETYFNERRPYFTQGNEIFMPAGKDRNSGFYSPLELFYSRRIGKKLPDGNDVPLLLGTKASGRIDDWEYGGFLAATGEKSYKDDTATVTEPRATFASARIKKQIFGNSSIGVLFVDKNTQQGDEGVIDIDGAFRASDWQLAYQLARSYQNSEGDYAASAGLRLMTQDIFLAVRTRYIGSDFDVNQVGYVPWIGTWQTTALCGPRWYFKEGYISEIITYAGPYLFNKKSEGYTDRSFILGWDMNFRTNWGYEVDFSTGYLRDEHVDYAQTELDLSMWFNVSPAWDANFYAGYVNHYYNFSRGYVAFYSWLGCSMNWRATSTVALGSSFESDIEGNPEGSVQENTLIARPYCSLTPVNDLNIRVYVDFLYTASDNRLQHVLGGFLFSYNFFPKSWIYLAINDMRQRNDAGDLAVTDRAAVLKVKYLYYF